MDKALAVTFIVAGFIALVWAVTTWHKLGKKGKGRNGVILLMALAGLGLGTGIGAINHAGLLWVKVGGGYIPLWVVIVAVFGLGFWYEFRGHGDHKTRTPVLCFALAMVLFLAIGNGMAADASHGVHQVEVDSSTHRGN